MANKLNRRYFILSVLAGGMIGAGFHYLFPKLRPLYHLITKKQTLRSETFIANTHSYTDNLTGILKQAFKELGIRREQILGKKILLKPNFVETRLNAPHVNTNPLVVYAAIETFLSMGASEVMVAEGPGHCRDTFRLLDQSGMIEVLRENNTPFVDINYGGVYEVVNHAKVSRLENLILPDVLKRIDIVVSMAKMKTHHWAGVTLSMKNLFGLMPGSYYGWPKNVLHWAGIDNAIIDINAAVKPSISIIDGIIGMEGDGPIMGNPKIANVLVVGKNSPAVDSTCARIMGIDPLKVKHLAKSSGFLGPILEEQIEQRGEIVSAVVNKFILVDTIPVHKTLL